MAILEVEGLTTHYFLKESRVRAADNITFSVRRGTTLGLAGESGCGKTTVALSLMRLLPAAGRIIKGKINLDGQDLMRLSREEMRKARWKEISYIFQYAMNAFNPVMNVGEQIAEVIIEKEGSSKFSRGKKKEAWEHVKNLFEEVGLDPNRVKDYPHEFSGGMKQRAVIAMALACDPKVIIADEPVTALDVVVEKQILALLKGCCEKYNLANILITHDLSVIAENSDEVGIMYAGRLVEVGTAKDLFSRGLHPYTQMLIESFPSILGEKKRIEPLKGIPPDLANPPPGCRFHPRCPLATEECQKKAPPYEEQKPRHFVACYHPGEIIS